MGKATRHQRGRKRTRPSFGSFRLLMGCAVVGALLAGYSAGGGVSPPQSSVAAFAGNIPSTLSETPIPTDKSLKGRASVIDGDTIEIAGQRIRFNGIDAPESAQRCQSSSRKAYACGRDAAKALDVFLAASRPVTCQFVEWDQYGRFVGNCVRADGRSVQEWVVANGHALDWPRYSNGAFAAQEASAKASRLGIWQGDFQKPWDWRAAQKTEPKAVAESPGIPLLAKSACNIKGNISAKGERIYHVPGQKHYDRTRISQNSGERWFCSENEARAAGWRKSKR